MKFLYRRLQPEFATRREETRAGTAGCKHRMECVYTGESNGTGMKFSCRDCTREEVTVGYTCAHEYVYQHTTGYSPTQLLSDNYECRLCGLHCSIGHGHPLPDAEESYHV